jgi:hypothetical protein
MAPIHSWGLLMWIYGLVLLAAVVVGMFVSGGFRGKVPQHAVLWRKRHKPLNGRRSGEEEMCQRHNHAVTLITRYGVIGRDAPFRIPVTAAALFKGANYGLCTRSARYSGKTPSRERFRVG